MPYCPYRRETPQQSLPAVFRFSSRYPVCIRLLAGGVFPGKGNNPARIAAQPTGSRTMTRTKFSPAAAVAVGLLFTLVGCEAKKSETPLSPSVAGPIPGVEISAPGPDRTLDGRQAQGRTTADQADDRELEHQRRAAAGVHLRSGQRHELLVQGIRPRLGASRWRWQDQRPDRPARDRAHVFLAGSRGGRCEQRALPHGAIRGPAQGVHLGAHADLSRQQ